MESVATGVYGAKVQSWRRSNPRDLLKRMIDEMPGADKSALLSVWRDLIRQPDNEDHLDAIIEYWFSNNYHSLVDQPRSRLPATKAQHRAAVSATTAVIKERATRMVLLDMVMPNGKALRDCTGRDCQRVGGWLSKIAAKIKPGEKVGAKLSEAQVRRLFSV